MKYKFDDNTDMSASIAQVTVYKYPSNLASKLKVYLEKLKSFPAQVKLLSDDLTNVKITQKPMYDMVRKLKDIGS